MELFLIIVLAAIIAIILIFSLSSKSTSEYGHYSQLDEISEREIIESGIEGENRAANLLSYLSDSYTIIHNVVIYYDGRKSEIDNVVIGNTGVFIIEVKNHKGYINGDCQEQEWMQRKIGKGGNEYSKEFYNPTKQVATHIYRLKHILLQNNIRTYISGAVYFANPEVIVNTVNSREDIPVFQYRNRIELLNYILDGKEKLTETQVKRIIEVITESNVNR